MKMLFMIKKLVCTGLIKMAYNVPSIADRQDLELQNLKIVQKMIEDTNVQLTTEHANSGKPLLYAGLIQ